VRKYLDKGFPPEGLNNATYLAAIEHFDTAIGRLVSAVDDMGLVSSTLVLFMSDNGGVDRVWHPNPPAVEPGEIVRLQQRDRWFSSAPLRAGKGSSYEGGIRVPMIARWTGAIKPKQTCRTPVHIVDLLSTFLELSKTSIPAGYHADGVSLLPLLQGKEISPRALYWYQPFYDVRWLATPSAMIREGDYKLLEFFGDYLEETPSGAVYIPSGRVELYDVREDIGETRNLVSAMPAKAEEMRRNLHAWIESTGSPIPGKNPRYNPQAPLFETRGQPPSA
jgi:uncharacterized sulfatase